VEEAIDRFEEAWQRGGRPAIGDHLPGDDPDRAALLVELVHVDLEYRLKSGEAVRVEEYLERYPELGQDRPVVLELLAAEWKLRRRDDSSVGPEEYARRFPDFGRDLLASATVSVAPPGPAATGSTEALGTPAPPVAPASAPAGDVDTRSRYRILRRHAQGGLGEILAARDEDLHREVALKRLLPRLAHAADSRTRFLREAEITSQLEHPGVVPVYGLGQAADGSPVYAMRLIRGETFQEAVERFHRADRPGRTAAERLLTFRQLLGRFVSVCNTVAYAHSRGVIHRDVKPGNILLGSYGETLLVDWGLAKPAGGMEPGPAPGADAAALPAGADLTQAGDIIGTPAYMSPEQAQGRWDVVGPASDVYSLGATLYVLLTGRPPFGPGAVAEVLESVRRGVFPRPRQVKTDVGPALEAVCLKAMAGRPEQRYDSALALAADLEKWLAGEPVGARREPVAARVARWMARNVTFVATSATLLAGAAVVAVVTALWFAAADRANSAAERGRLAGELAEARQKELDRADQERYYFHIAAADRDWWLNRFGAAAAHLIECKERLRGWEWNYMGRRGGDSESLLTFTGHAKEVWNVVYSPHGETLASASMDGTVRVWDASDGKLLHKLEGHKGPVWGVAYSPDGALLATGGDDGTVRLWDAKTGEARQKLDGPGGGVFGVAFSHDGRLLAAAVGGPGVDRIPLRGQGGEVDLWDLPAGTKRKPLSLPTTSPTSVAFSPDDQDLAAGASDGTVKRWGVAAGAERLALVGPQKGVAIQSVAYSADGLWIAGAASDGRAGLWDVHTDTGKPTHSLDGGLEMAWGTAFSPDSRRLAVSADDRTIKVWDVTLGRLLFVLHGHTQGIANVTFSPDGDRLASASDDQTVKVWDAHGPQASRKLCGHKHAVWGVAISPDGRRIASAGADAAEAGAPADDDAVRVWDDKGAEVVGLLAPGGAHAVSFGPGGRLLAAAGGDGTVRVWDAEAGWAEHVLRGHADAVLAVAFSRDGRLLASASADHNVMLWDTTTWSEVRTLRGHTDVVRCVAFSPDDKVLASGGDDKEVVLWDAGTGEARAKLTGRPTPVYCVAFSPDGKRLAAATAAAQKTYTQDAGEIAVWDLETNQTVLTLRGRAGDVLAVTYSPDGKRLVSAGWDGTVKIWEPTTGQEILTLYEGHLNAVNALAFSPDGGRLASASSDGTVILWNGAPSDSGP
jgi:WD40 repeat protein